MQDILCFLARDFRNSRVIRDNSMYNKVMEMMKKGLPTMTVQVNRKSDYQRPSLEALATSLRDKGEMMNRCWFGSSTICTVGDNATCGGISY